ncbi:L-type lectin-domain containing receptor kinase IV.1-like isoform X2 [Asparagus officinalis]|uniref:L-type lectin-domain containing receptor kinase IV.1-like isoform X2 n=1 Tax=Asparagus officinalis TaxID=4686 RepID=UPI00098E5AD8|nr:L-type lectin-domain containing receptor kinase IV.1-like isoform X2 [Asparagus officinalis]
MLTKFLIPLLLIQLVSSSKNDFIFKGFNATNLSLNGVAEITSDGLVQLTNNTANAVGRAFYPFLLPFKNSKAKSASFSTTFVFAIVPQYKDISGHGMVFAISPTKQPLGSASGPFFGLFNDSNSGKETNHIVAIEFDTSRAVGLGDIDANHVGIDINGVRSLNASSVAYFDKENKPKRLNLISGNPMQVWVDYGAKDMKLDVRITPIGLSKPKIPLVSSKVDLSSIYLDDMYAGFSASTGDGTAFHYVLGWSFSLDGNAQDLDISKLPSVPRQDTTQKGPNILTVVLPLVAVILLLVTIAVSIVIVRRRKKFAELLEDWELEYGPHRFTYKDLFKATKGFKEEHLLGVGGFGRVYKGILPSSKLEIAVKKISHESQQGMKEFVAEIVSMGRLRHRNLVQLLGYCRRKGELLLVYEFMPNGSLDKFLFGGKKKMLGWSQRFQIIKGVASGLLYLHEGWEQVVIHRDIKAANVLLDHDLNGKLGDFGLAKLYDHGSNPQTTHIVGTLGYLAPELSKTGKATIKTDAFAYGAFLLEVACGRRPMVMRGTMPNLVDWVLELWKKGMILEASDPDLESDYVVKEMELVLKLGLFCSHPDPEARPTMRQVMQFLEGDAPLPVMPLDYLAASSSAYDESFDDFIMSYPSISSHTVSGSSSSQVFRQ